MWIVISIVLAIFLLILLSSISHKMKTIEALEYMNSYLFKQLVKNNGVEGLEDYEMKLNELEKDSKAKEGAKALSRIKRSGYFLFRFCKLKLIYVKLSLKS
ncbi:putative exported phage protein [Staphylococcus aureus]|uniref:Putative exported phage protein n=1 Tax=Staphylococcus aureus TaxID=1280 RepID=A0A380EF26_STAAU|nr:putative exported phage protein [Staphylococcus aureus]